MLRLLALYVIATLLVIATLILSSSAHAGNVVSIYGFNPATAPVASGISYGAAAKSLSYGQVIPFPPGVSGAMASGSPATSLASSTATFGLSDMAPVLGRLAGLGLGIAATQYALDWLFDCSGGQLGDCPLVPVGYVRQPDGTYKKAANTDCYSWGDVYCGGSAAACNARCQAAYSNSASVCTYSGITYGPDGKIIANCMTSSSTLQGSTGYGIPNACLPGAVLQGGFCVFNPADPTSKAAAAADFGKKATSGTPSTMKAKNFIPDVVAKVKAQSDPGALSRQLEAVSPGFMTQTALTPTGPITMPSPTTPGVDVQATPTVHDQNQDPYIDLSPTESQSPTTCATGFYLQDGVCVENSSITNPTLPTDIAKEITLQSVLTKLTGIYNTLTGGTVTATEPTASTTTKAQIDAENLKVTDQITGLGPGYAADKTNIPWWDWVPDWPQGACHETTKTFKGKTVDYGLCDFVSKIREFLYWFFAVLTAIYLWHTTFEKKG